jgi:uncharacterized DUF497 family protein
VYFEWDPVKARSNLAKHGVDLADAGSVFLDPWAATARDDHPSEERFVTMGCDRLRRVLVVSYTWRDDVVRIISARRATAAERRRYEEGR